MKRALILTVCLLLMPGALATELDTKRKPAALEYRWIPGKTYVQTSTMDQSATFNFGGQEMKQSSQMEMALKIDVAEADNGSTTLAMAYDRMKLTVDAMGQKMVYDSTDESTHEGSMAGMGAMLGKTITVTLDDANAVVKTSGLDELLEGAGGNPAAAQMMKQMFDESQLDQMMNSWMVRSFPAGKVKPGDSWPLKWEWQMGTFGSVTYEGTSTLAGYLDYDGHDCAVIDTAAKINLNLDGDDGGMQQMMAQMGMSLEASDATTRVYWDQKLGNVRGMEMGSTMTMSMTNPQDGQKIEIPMRQELKLAVEVK